MCVAVFHWAHFAALKFYNVARFRKSKQISADIKQLMCVLSDLAETEQEIELLGIRSYFLIDSVC